MSDPGETARALVSHYEQCLRTHGNGARAVDWQSEHAATLRYDVMLDLCDPDFRPEGQRIRLLDFGCGLGGLLDHIEKQGHDGVDYIGLDLSQAYVDAARAAHPEAQFMQGDALAADMTLPRVDVIVMNGIFTRRGDASAADMLDYAARLLERLWQNCDVGLAFNVMAHDVDWPGEALFHPTPDELAQLISGLTRHWCQRSDYGLFETSVFLYKQPRNKQI